MFVQVNIRWVPREVLKTSTFGLDFQHLPRDLANVNARKNMFDPYIKMITPLEYVVRSSYICIYNRTD